MFTFIQKHGCPSAQNLENSECPGNRVLLKWVPNKHHKEKHETGIQHLKI